MMVEGDPRRGKWMACIVGCRSDAVQCLGCSSCERPCLQPWSVVEPQLQLARLGQSQPEEFIASDVDAPIERDDIRTEATAMAGHNLL